jgi:hypothetical protein
MPALLELKRDKEVKVTRNSHLINPAVCRTNMENKHTFVVGSISALFLTSTAATFTLSSCAHKCSGVRPFCEHNIHGVMQWKFRWHLHFSISKLISSLNTKILFGN